MKVRVFPYETANYYGNIIWDGRYPMLGGRFPKEHPCADALVPFCFGQPKEMNDSALDSFRRLGYEASCFPEGDGITYRPLNSQSDKQQIADIKQAFGWEIRR